MEISGGRAVWKDVLAVYAVKTNTDKDNPQEVATMDESKSSDTEFQTTDGKLRKPPASSRRKSVVFFFG